MAKVTYKALVNARDALDKVLSSGSLQMDKFDDQQSLSSNSFSMFGGRASSFSPDTHESVHLDPFQGLDIS